MPPARGSASRGLNVCVARSGNCTNEWCCRTVIDAGDGATWRTSGPGTPSVTSVIVVSTSEFFGKAFVRGR